MHHAAKHPTEESSNLMGNLTPAPADAPLCDHLRNAAEPEWSCWLAEGHESDWHVRGNVFWKNTIPLPSAPAAVIAASNHAQDVIYAEFDRQGVDPYDEDAHINLEAMAAAVIERLLSEGVVIPDTIIDPFLTPTS